MTYDSANEETGKHVIVIGSTRERLEGLIVHNKLPQGACMPGLCSVVSLPQQPFSSLQRVDPILFDANRTYTISGETCVAEGVSSLSSGASAGTIAAALGFDAKLLEIQGRPSGPPRKAHGQGDTRSF